MDGQAMAERREIDTSTLGPIRIDHDEIARKRGRAGQVLDRHSPDDMHASSREQRRGWLVDAMIAFANEEIRLDRERRGQSAPLIARPDGRGA